MIAAVNLALKNGAYTFLAHEPLEMISQEEIGCVVDSGVFQLNSIVDKLLDTHYSKTGFPKSDKQKYILADYEYGEHRPEYLYKLIVRSEEVLTRCLSLWVKSTMLFQYRAFQEEATSQMYFALDGLVKLHQKRLNGKYQGISLKDTFDRLIEALPVYCGMAEYAATCYENRTMLVHPVNDFDEAWNVPLLADDYFETADLFKALVKAYLVPQESGLE
ncbi:hypothetical protein [Alicyclobacillus sp. SP_1]|uniref:hypothetical protein n=1 Tax=Alicyclobacillus sp. SP_1 TaxID=2942475 RepID=UPI002157234E|nr:hypothetical protein [Alicyclobacillus sp. SP_1]